MCTEKIPHYSAVTFIEEFIVMQNSRRTATDRRWLSLFRRMLVTGFLATIMSEPGLFTATAAIDDVDRRIEALASLATDAPMLTVTEGPFLMGTTRNNSGPFSLDLHYDDTEQPRRRIWLDEYQIDRDEVSLGEYVRWRRQQPGLLPEELRNLITHATRVHAQSSETLARWPALYVTWSEASHFCRAQGKRLPTEAEWEKAARGEHGNLFPWGQQPPTPALAMFGQSHVHEIPIVAAVANGAEGRSPYGLHHMAGNAAEWVEDWLGIDYYMTMPDRNPHGPANGRYKVVRGGSWKSTPALLRTATRNGASPNQRAATIGFRCAQSTREVPGTLP